METEFFYGNLFLFARLICVGHSSKFYRLCQNLTDDMKPRRAVFLTDVPGVYDKNPKYEDAKLMKSIIVRRDGTVRTDIHV